jgi:hypothetical protein
MAGVSVDSIGATRRTRGRGHHCRPAAAALATAALLAVGLVLAFWAVVAGA